jgi:hypothetical protein
MNGHSASPDTALLVAPSVRGCAKAKLASCVINTDKRIEATRIARRNSIAMIAQGSTFVTLLQHLPRPDEEGAVITVQRSVREVCLSSHSDLLKFAFVFRQLLPVFQRRSHATFSE